MVADAGLWYLVNWLMVLSCHLVVFSSQLITLQRTPPDTSSMCSVEHLSTHRIPCSLGICYSLVEQVTPVFVKYY